MPLKADPSGVIRVGGTRVTLDAVVIAFQEGATAEEVVHRIPSLALADVYEVFAYYLRNQNVVDAYLQDRQGESDQMQRKAESRFDPAGVRDRLLARRGQ